MRQRQRCPTVACAALRIRAARVSYSLFLGLAPPGPTAPTLLPGLPPERPLIDFSRGGGWDAIPEPKTIRKLNCSKLRDALGKAHNISAPLLDLDEHESVSCSVYAERMKLSDRIRYFDPVDRYAPALIGKITVLLKKRPRGLNNAITPHGINRADRLFAICTQVPPNRSHLHVAEEQEQSRNSECYFGWGGSHVVLLLTRVVIGAGHRGRTMSGLDYQRVTHEMAGLGSLRINFRAYFLRRSPASGPFL